MKVFLVRVHKFRKNSTLTTEKESDNISKTLGISFF